MFKSDGIPSLSTINENSVSTHDVLESATTMLATAKPVIMKRVRRKSPTVASPLSHPLAPACAIASHHQTSSAMAQAHMEKVKKRKEERKQKEEQEFIRAATETLAGNTAITGTATIGVEKPRFKKDRNNKWTIQKWEEKDRAIFFKADEHDHIDSNGNTLPPLIPTDPGFDPNVMTTWVKSRKFNIVRYLVDIYFKYIRHWLMANFVQSLRLYCQHIADLDLAGNRERKTTWLNSFQCCLSLFRRQLKERNVHYHLLKYVRMSRQEKYLLEKQKRERLEKASENVSKLDGADVITRARTLLQSEDPATVVICLAALTGRRMSELILSGNFGPPQNTKWARPTYWSNFTGVLKQREWDKDKVNFREIPLLAPRQDINEAIERLRDLWPATSNAEVNKLYSSRVSKKMKELFPQIGTLHTFRKVYCPITYFHFNDELNFSLPRFASEVLAHKSIHGGRLLTYLNVNVTNLENIEF